MWPHVLFPSLGHDSSSDGDAPTPEARLVPSTGVAHLNAVRECAQVFVGVTHGGEKSTRMEII